MKLLIPPAVSTSGLYQPSSLQTSSRSSVRTNFSLVLSSTKPSNIWAVLRFHMTLRKVQTLDSKKVDAISMNDLLLVEKLTTDLETGYMTILCNVSG